jgi:hypothetical protein
MPDEQIPKSEVEVLQDKVAWLEQQLRLLTEERDKAIKAKETLIRQVLPMSAAKADRPAWAGRGLSMLILFLLLAAIAGMAIYMPSFAKKVSGGGALPAGVQVRQDEPGEPAGEETATEER